MKILFATDLKEPRTITDRIQSFATRLDADLYVLHVHVPTPTTPLGIDPLSGFGEVSYALYDPSIEESIVEAEQSDFDAFVQERFTRPVRPALHHGDPARVILHDASELGADLLILAKRRHSALERMLLGSVTKVVANEATQPVLLLPIPDQDRA
jgi:nucleotide-binding universal stress UspA family protein